MEITGIGAGELCCTDYRLAVAGDESGAVEADLVLSIIIKKNLSAKNANKRKDEVKTFYLLNFLGGLGVLGAFRFMSSDRSWRRLCRAVH